jgi:hypothetical protein
MGFTDDLASSIGLRNGFRPVVSDTQAYRQFGNAVVPAVVEAVGAQVAKVLSWQVQRAGCLLKETAAAVPRAAAKAS